MSIDGNAWIQDLDKVKRHLSLDVDDTEHDTFLETLVNASYKMLEEYIGHAIADQEYTEYYDGSGTNELITKQYPIISVDELNDDKDRDFDADTLIPATDYVIDATKGAIRLFKNTLSFAEGIQNIKIVYTAGYTTVPADLELASIMHVAWLFGRASTEGKTSQSLGGKSETYDADSLPPYIKRILTPHRTFAV